MLYLAQFATFPGEATPAENPGCRQCVGGAFGDTKERFGNLGQLDIYRNWLYR